MVEKLRFGGEGETVISTVGAARIEEVSNAFGLKSDIFSSSVSA